MKKRTELYAGKAKTVYTTDDPDRFILEFRDDTSAFDGEKVEQLLGKGVINNKFNAFIMTKLQAAGIPTHFEQLLSERESVVKRLDMIPVECVIRNISAGSLCRRLGVAEGETLTPPVFEFFFKNDALHDPMINDSHIITFGWANEREISRMKELTLKVNGVLKQLFGKAGLLLVDYKLEYGRFDGEIILGDEFSPDGCRLWDAGSREKFDKDRFRQGMGSVVESYAAVAERLGIAL